jgi:2-polyprenyl-3-methyl-5-hydroxy-6-metoxy-1,4-benzoquinol methylase
MSIIAPNTKGFIERVKAELDEWFLEATSSLMRFVKMDPPGSWCQYEAALEMIQTVGGKSFIEVGCGSGDLSLRLCQKGWTGLGVDFSQLAIEQAKANLSEFIEAGRYRVIEGDMFDLDLGGEKFDIAVNMMVMEHVDDDAGFLKRIREFVVPGGHVIVAVPGRRDRWGIEDDTVGHKRRYDRDDLEQVLLAAGLSEVKIWSVAVPVANLLFHIGNFFVRNSSEINKLNQSTRQQTETSGIREVPWKTTFPSPFKLILNRGTLYPLLIMQRLFYGTSRGLTLMASGRVN